MPCTFARAIPSTWQTPTPRVSHTCVLPDTTTPYTHLFAHTCANISATPASSHIRCPHRVSIRQRGLRHHASTSNSIRDSFHAMPLSSIIRNMILRKKIMMCKIVQVKVLLWTWVFTKMDVCKPLCSTYHQIYLPCVCVDWIRLVFVFTHLVTIALRLPLQS